MIDGTETEDILNLPLDRFLNRVIAWLRPRFSEGDWRNLRFQLEVPPPGVTPSSGPWSEEEMAATWPEDRMTDNV